MHAIRGRRRTPRVAGMNAALAHRAPIVRMALGQGLRVSGLLPSSDGYLPVQGEGGQVTLPACTDEEAAMVRWSVRRFGHAAAEHFLSTRGLTLLHEALSDVRGRWVRPLPAADIVGRARAGSDALCADVVAQCGGWIATIASDLALTFGAFGGVYIEGPLACELEPLLASAAFRRRFEDKGRFASYLAKVPVYIADQCR